MNPSRRTVALIGAGATRNAWSPVIAALKSEFVPDIATPDGANFAMARLVYAARLLHMDGARKNAQEEVLGKLAKIRARIGENLVSAEERGDLHLRDDFESVLRDVVFAQSNHVTVVTTNWDTQVEQGVRRISTDTAVLHVHGSIETPNGLYLPSEVVEEPYRGDAERRALDRVRSELVKAVDSAERLVVYGLGLSALDAELGQLLASGLDKSRVKEAYVVDPKYPEVAERLATLSNAGSPELPIYGAAPTALSNWWTFAGDQIEAEQIRVQREAVQSV